MGWVGGSILKPEDEPLVDVPDSGNFLKRRCEVTS